MATGTGSHDRAAGHPNADSESVDRRHLGPDANASRSTTSEDGVLSYHESMPTRLFHLMTLPAPA